ncbi:unnamed protein product [Vitrella brassicaformis CCMP3155]|uniref:Uncharacterized protein n=2 Tax=Vitrella brassicaformis TaxID=1169539 RepID=A0A0G4F743_VITBC|nr:unnamed protein product [Vitrella brassicaformis CCMP3155]|mmetsp:Transcript_23334/g.66911  ORF Transcript_23334/g.66911 Transcript_23334/m.66911 type:complete len:109 (-) Transcript_23334:2555-2881(-)|eukprot:CEM07824.1 unnamed protein product [Vitrella brassicaformis CCMP3155]
MASLVDLAHLCCILSVFGFVLLTLWGLLLVTHSPPFALEVAPEHRTSGGISCILAGLGYLACLVLSWRYIRRSRQRRGWNGGRDDEREVELRSLLGSGGRERPRMPSL